MPVAVTIDALRDRVRTATRQPNVNGFISNQELDRIILEGAYSLYNLLIAARGEHYYVVEWGSNTVPGGKRMILPDNFYRLVSVMISEKPGPNAGLTQPQGALWYEIPRMHPQDWASQESLPGTDIRSLKYAVEGETHGNTPTAVASIALYPAPQAVWNLRVRYLPTLDLTAYNGSIIFDGVNGFDAYVVAYAAETVCAMQEDSTAAFWNAKKAALEAQIRGLASDRDGATAAVVKDVRWGTRRGYPRA